MKLLLTLLACAALALLVAVGCNAADRAARHSGGMMQKGGDSKPPRTYRRPYTLPLLH